MRKRKRKKCGESDTGAKKYDSLKVEELSLTVGLRINISENYFLVNISEDYFLCLVHI